MPASANMTAGGGKKLVLFVEEHGGDWHARRLTAALEARGATVVVTTLKACAFDTRTACGLDIPGFDGALPDGAFVRSISSGNLEQITLRLGILHALRDSGVRVWNDARTIERCVDKSTATFLFQKAGLPVPETRVVEGREAALTYARAKQEPLVVKPLFGSQGNGVMRADTANDLPPSDDVGDVFYLQRYLRPSDADNFDDIRVFVSAGRVIASMSREGAHWVTNVHQGGRPTPHALEPQTRDLALAACAAIGVDYAGVDLIRDPDQDRLLVLEINSNPAWKGLQSITQVDVAEILAADFLECLKADTQTHALNVRVLDPVPSPEVIKQAFLDACNAELTALKPGNVHIHADGHDMDIHHFKTAANAAAPYIADSNLSVGERILKAVTASMEAAGCNTNLGILLLTAPLAKAAETTDRTGNLQGALEATLAALTDDDATAVYKAIERANPGGLGTAATGDVRDGPGDLSLVNAMRLAADTDRIANAYATGFRDIFDHHLPALEAARRHLNGDSSTAKHPPQTITTLYMTLLTAFPDSHITRKFGTNAASSVQSDALAAREHWYPIAPGPAPSELLALDAKWKADRLNPGTTADFVVATLFADAIRA